MKTDVVIFDLFGTLVNLGIQHHPYRRLLKWARDHGRKPLSDDARTIMTTNGDLQQIANQMGINPPAKLIRKLSAEIELELESVTLFDDVIPILDQLQYKNVRMAICSNLAAPYGQVIDRLLHEYPANLHLSYETGVIKPEADMYHGILRRMDVNPVQCLFVGDTYFADVWGPQQVGMNAIIYTVAIPLGSAFKRWRHCLITFPNL